VELYFHSHYAFMSWCSVKAHGQFYVLYFKRDDVAGDWRRLRNVELHNSYASPNSNDQIKDEMGGTCSTYGREVLKILWLEHLKGRGNSKDLDTKGILGK
jgi:hypothetical protein